MLQGAGFPPPVIMHLIHLCAADEDADAKASLLADTCRLARHLSWKRGRPWSPPRSAPRPDPGTSRRSGGARLRRYAEVVTEENCILAVEPHVGQELDTPHKARWLMDAVDHPRVRLNFDYSHYLVQGIELQQSLDLTAGYSVHTHIKDGRMVDGKVQFALPGDDRLDLVAYLRSVRAAGLDVPITVEVSAQIWGRDDYDPWPVAEHCFANLEAARQAAT